MFLEKEIQQLTNNISKIPDEFWVLAENGKRVIWFLNREDGTAGDYETSQERLGLTKEGEIIYGFASGCSCFEGWKADDYCPTLSYKEFTLKKIHTSGTGESYNRYADKERDAADISFAEGWDKESLSNMQDFLALVNPDLTPKEVLAVKNAEIKRIGYENIKGDVGASVVHVDGTSELLKFADGEQYVKVKDASTDREYLLYVPNNIETCKQGIAWTFGLEAGEYHPVIET